MEKKFKLNNHLFVVLYNITETSYGMRIKNTNPPLTEEDINEITKFSEEWEKRNNVTIDRIDYNHFTNFD